MWKTICLILHVACLCQGLASGDSSKSQNGFSASESQNIPNIVLDPDQASVLATLEHLQQENAELRQEMRQSLDDVMEEVRDLKTMRDDLRDLVMKMMTDMGRDMRQQMQEASKQMQSQMAELVTSVGQMETQQGGLMEQGEVIQGVMEAVQEFQDEADNITSHLEQLQARVTALEDGMRTLKEEDSDRLSDVQHRMDNLESLVRNLQAGQGRTVPVPTVYAELSSYGEHSTPPSSPSPTTTMIPDTPSYTDRSRPWFRWSSSSSTPSSPPTTERIWTWWTQTSPPSALPLRLEPDYDVHRVFIVSRYSDALSEALVNFILTTKGGKLILNDREDDKLIMSSLDSPGTVEDIHRMDKPWALLELDDGTIAVTYEFGRRIAIFTVTNDELQLVRHIPTEKMYFGITQGPDNTLIVSTRSNDYGSACIDVIDMDGTVLRTIVQDSDYIIAPYTIRRFKDDVYVSDWVSARVYRVNIYSGEVSFIVGSLNLADLDFYQPRSFDIDSYGDLYIATGGRVCNRYNKNSFCIVFVSHTGEWRVMRDYGAGGYPYGVRVTPDQVIISWCSWEYGWNSEIDGFSLPQMHYPPTPKAEESSTPGEVSSSGQPMAVSNVALHKPALQSTYHPRYGHPERAVDGSQASHISQCTHTADVDSNPNRWWRVDLMGMFEVEAVVITNRGDCCGQRLTNFDVYVMKTLEDPSEREHNVADLCVHSNDHIPDGATVRLDCDQPMVGQYVSLVLNTNSWPLHFCEIQVLGRPAPGYSTPIPMY